MAIFLPKPEGLFFQGTLFLREQCVEQCSGCNKIYSDGDTGDVCIAYLYPKEKWRQGNCALASHAVVEEGTKPKKFINPIKRSKRGS